MPRSVNRVTLLGHLGKDPELKYTPSGQAVTKLRMATSDRWKDKNGEWQDRTEWHDVVLWAKMAETANQYLSKGSQVFIEGRLQTRSWDDKEGKKHYATEIVAQDMVLLGGRGGGERGGEARRTAAPAATSGGDDAEPPRGGGPEITDDDIPF
ncbi:MAG: single-stranded DNA-binding protein [Terriglobales bacterium]